VSSRLAALAAALLLMLPPLDPWLDAAMPRHLLIQMPALLGLGAVAAWPAAAKAGWTPTRAAALAWGIGALAFWMIPRALDMAVVREGVDQAMHLSMVSAGAALARSVPRLPFAPRVALALHAVAMLAAMGMAYQSYPGVICSAYDLPQQRAAGAGLLLAAPLLWVMVWAGVAAHLAGVGSGRRCAEPDPPAGRWSFGYPRGKLCE